MDGVMIGLDLETGLVSFLIVERGRVVASGIIIEVTGSAFVTDGWMSDQEVAERLESVFAG